MFPALAEASSMPPRSPTAPTEALGIQSTSHTSCTYPRVETLVAGRQDRWQVACGEKNGRSEGGGTRTHDLGIKSPLLYQLSYAPEGPLNIFAPNRLDNPTALTHSRLPLVPGAKMVALLFGFMPV
jgi:hypothetical protein